MRILLLTLLVSAGCLAGPVLFGLDSGVTAPISNRDNMRYNPSIYVQPSIYLCISDNALLSASYGYVFARGGELIEDTGSFGDSFGNYNTQLQFLKFGMSREYAPFDLSGGFGFWSYRTKRDLVGDWAAD